MRAIWTGKKQELLEPAIAVLIVCYYMGRRIRLVNILVVGIPLLVVTFGVLNVYRAHVRSTAATGPRTIDEGLGRIWDSLEYRSADSSLTTSAAFSLLDRQFGVDTLALVVKYTPERADFSLGKPYLLMPLHVFVPRALWADKPINYITGAFEDIYAPGWKDTYTSPHVMSDLYCNFHLFGIVGGMFIIGLVLKLIYNACNLSPQNPAGICFYAVMIPGIVHGFEWEPVTICVFYLRYAIVLYAILWALSRMNPRSRPQAHTAR